jgi:hypothetical protein
MTLTLNKSYTQLPVGTSKKRPLGDRKRARRHDIASAQGRKVPHDGPAKVPVRLDAGRCKGVAGVQMAGMRSVLVPAKQSGRCASRQGGSSDVGRAAKTHHGDIQQCGIVEWG